MLVKIKNIRFRHDMNNIYISPEMQKMSGMIFHFKCFFNQERHPGAICVKENGWVWPKDSYTILEVKYG